MIILFNDIYWEHLLNQKTWHLVWTPHAPQVVLKEAAGAMKPLPSWSPSGSLSKEVRGEGGRPNSARSHGFLASHFDVLCLWSKSFPIGRPSSPVSSLAPAVYQREGAFFEGVKEKWDREGDNKDKERVREQELQKVVRSGEWVWKPLAFQSTSTIF